MPTSEAGNNAEQHPAEPAAPLRAAPIRWDAYQQANQHIFPTAESWQWFARQHRAELIERGAVCYLAGRVFVVPDAFNAAIVEIGCRLAAARAA